LVANITRSALAPKSQSRQSPLLTSMPMPQCDGMRPKRSSPNGVRTSAQARLARIDDHTLLSPGCGDCCVREKATNCTSLTLAAGTGELLR
jgi:hypothetical protein